MKAESLDAHSKLLELQSRLTKFAYLSKEPLPGLADAMVFQKLKNAQKMPTKDRYFNFYHWFIMMSQFAPKEIERWSKEKELVDDDKLIIDCLVVIDSLKSIPAKRSEQSVDYKPIDSNLTMCKNKLLSLNVDQIGEELRINFKSYQDRINQYSENSNQLRIMFKLCPTSCEKLKDIVSKWSQVKNIQIKRQPKEKKQ